MSNETVYLHGTIRDRIKDLMKAKKMTQAELAIRSGFSESILSHFISSNRIRFECSDKKQGVSYVIYKRTNTALVI